MLQIDGKKMNVAHPRRFTSNLPHVRIEVHI